ncbi:MAG: TIGR03435 family protein, partial [Ignavibacteriota bacterium]
SCQRHRISESSPAPGTADDGSGPTLVQALQKELGLRLEKSANGTKNVLVVDHAEKVPTGN